MSYEYVAIVLSVPHRPPHSPHFRKQTTLPLSSRLPRLAVGAYPDFLLRGPDQHPRVRVSVKKAA